MNEKDQPGSPPVPNREGVVPVVGAAILQTGRCLVGKRAPGGSAGGRWEFPGGKVKSGESPQSALRREIFEELALSIEVGPYLGRGVVQDGPLCIVLDVYLATLSDPGQNAKKQEHDELMWANADDFSRLDWADADIPVLPDVLALLKE